MSEKNSSRGVQLLLRAVTVLLCLLLFFSTAAAVLLADVRLLTSRGGLQSIILPLLTPGPVSTGPVCGRAGVQSAPVRPVLRAPADTGLDSQAFVAMLYDLLDQQIEGGLPVTLAQVQGFFRESTAPEFLSAKAAEVISSVCTGGLSAAVSNSELMTLVEENRALIEKHFSCTMDEVAMTALSDWLEQNRAAEVMTEKIQGTLLNGTAQPGGDIDAPGSNAMATVSTAMGIVRKLTAAAPLLIAGALCAVLTGLLFLSCWGRPHSALLAGGWTYLAAGILFLLPCACAPVLRSLLPGGVGAAAGNALALTWPTGTAAAVLGIAMIAGGFLLKARKKAPVPQTNE